MEVNSMERLLAEMRLRELMERARKNSRRKG